MGLLQPDTPHVRKIHVEGVGDVQGAGEGLHGLLLSEIYDDHLRPTDVDTPEKLSSVVSQVCFILGISCACQSLCYA